MSAPCRHVGAGNSELRCRDCGLNLNSNDSMKVHNMFSHHNNLPLWTSTGDIDNNNQTKKIGNTIAAADSSDKQPATPTGPSTSMEHPATPQSYHSAPSPYQQGTLPEMQQYSPAPAYNTYEYYGLSVEGMPQHHAYMTSDYNKQFKVTNNRFQPYNKFSPPVTSSTPNNGLLTSQPTPSPSPNQCDKCGCLCESAGQLSEHCATAHPTGEDGSPHYQYSHNYAIQKESTASEFLDLDSQRVISKDDSDKNNSVPSLNPSTQSSHSWSDHPPSLPQQNLNILPDQRTIHPQDHKIFAFEQKFLSDQKPYPQDIKPYVPEIKPFPVELKPFQHPPPENKPYQTEKMFQQDVKLFSQPQQHNEQFEHDKVYSEPKQIIYQQNDTKMFSPTASNVDQQKPFPVAVSGPTQPPLMASPPDFPTTTTPQDPPYRSFDPPGPQISSSHTAPTKGAAWKSNEARRPKTYNCTACNKWFTSSGHLKRHYNTTLHKNAVKTSGKSDPATLPISTHHHPGRDPNHPSHRTQQSSPPQSSAPLEPPTQSPEPQGFPPQQHYLPPPQHLPGFGHTQGYQHMQNYVQAPMGQPPTNLAPPPGPSIGAPSGPLHGLSPHQPMILTQNFVENPPNGQAGPSANNIHLRGLQTPSTLIHTSYNNHTHITLEQPQLMELAPLTTGEATYNMEFQVMPQDMGLPNYPTTTGDQQITLPSFQVLQNGSAKRLINNRNDMQQYTNDTNTNNMGFNGNGHFVQYCTTVIPSYMQHQLKCDNVPALAPLSYIKQEPVEYILPETTLSPEDDSGYISNISTTNIMDHIEHRANTFFDPMIVTSSTSTTELPPPLPSPIVSQSTITTPIPTSSPTVNSSTSDLPVPTLSLPRPRKPGVVTCEICNKDFAKQCYLTQHNKRRHEAPMSHKCDICGKWFSANSKMQEHKKRHDPKYKKHKCEFCVKVFNHKTDLNRHMSIHTGYKRFSCEYCKRGFVRRDHMIKHGIVHGRRGVVMDEGKFIREITPPPAPVRKPRKNSKKDPKNQPKKPKQPEDQDPSSEL